jgi:hypothetical protein
MKEQTIDMILTQILALYIGILIGKCFHFAPQLTPG